MSTGYHRQEPKGVEGGGVRSGEGRLRQLHHSKIIFRSVVDPDPHWRLYCSGSEIQIRIGNADLDLSSRSIDIDQNLQINWFPVFEKGFVRCFCTFHVKN